MLVSEWRQKAGGVGTNWGFAVSLFGEDSLHKETFGCLHGPIEAKASPTDICNPL